MDDDNRFYDDFDDRYGPFPPRPHGPGVEDALTLALLEDLAEITASLYRVLCR